MCWRKVSFVFRMIPKYLSKCLLASCLVVGGATSTTGSGCVEHPGVGADCVVFNSWIEGYLLRVTLCGSGAERGGKLNSTVLSLETDNLRSVQGLNTACGAGLYSFLLGVSGGFWLILFSSIVLIFSRYFSHATVRGLVFFAIGAFWVLFRSLGESDCLLFSPALEAACF